MADNDGRDRVGLKQSGIFETRSADDVESARQRILDLGRRRDEKKQELADLRVFHADAWREYGSELCSGGMVREERELEAEVQSLSDDLTLLEEYLRGERTTEAPAAEMRLAAIADHRQTLDRQQAAATQDSLRAARLRQLLGR